MKNIFIAKIAVEKSSARFDKLFDYIIPDIFIDKLKKGCRVIIPFGKSNKKCQGLIFDIICINENNVKNLKEIYHVIDKTPIIDYEMFKIIDFLVNNTFCTYFEAIKTLIPPGINYNVIKTYSVIKNIQDIYKYYNFNKLEMDFISFLSNTKSDKEVNKFFIDNKTSISQYKKIIKNLLNKNIISVNEVIKRKINDNIIKSVYLNEDIQIYKKLSSKQNKVISYLKEFGNTSIKELCYNCGVTSTVIKNLFNKNIVLYSYKEVYKDPIVYKNIDNHYNDEIKLNNEQFSVYNNIYNQYLQNKPSVALLYGITGSGKTHVFIKLIQDVIKDNKQIIFLVPEISLTSQIVNMFKILFKDSIAIIHSNLSVSERLDQWKKIKAGKVSIVIGTRSAIFAPLKNIGMIIIDEEGEPSYKSENSPRYHTRDIAKLRCFYNNSLLLLSSATPSIESYYNAKIGKYSLYKLNKRYSNNNLPNVNIIDLKNNIILKNNSFISDELLEQLKYNINNSQQSIIFVNRRGYSSSITCFSCNSTLICNNCSIAMVYHKSNNSMVCHYCGYIQEMPSKCVYCKSDLINLKGMGTQKIEDEIKSMIPNARVLRMDSDTVISKYSYEDKFSLFLNKKYDIMIGTQMIAKGLNFPDVTLVGVVSIDSLLYSNDFRCNERTFSLITQVIGRSGRGKTQGRAYIQTFIPENNTISFASKQDYDSFYENEIFFRKSMLYPPFCDICIIGLSCKNEKKLDEYSKLILNKLIYIINTLNYKIPIKILGISTPNIYKLNNKYRKRIIIKCKVNKLFRNIINIFLEQIRNENKFNNLSLFIDINGNINF